MQISEEIEELKSKYSNIDFEVWDNQMLMRLFCELNINAQQIILSNYMESIYDIQGYLGRLEIENITQDIDYIRALKENAQKLMKLINTNDFVAPFPVIILEYIDIYTNNLEQIEFNNDNLVQLKNASLSNIYELLTLIHKYTKPINHMAVMKRIEPWGEIKDENFDDVRDRMYQARTKVYCSIEDLLNQEIALINQLKNIKN